MTGDVELVRRAVGGDREAIRALVRRLYPVIRARASVYLARGAGRRLDADADDLAQTIWLRLLEDDGRMLRAWDPARGKSLEGWVGMLSQRELWLRARAAATEKRGAPTVPIDTLPVPGGGASPETEAQRRDLLGRLLDHLWGALGERGREVLAAVYLDGLSPAQAAETLGVTAQVVYNWQHRVRREARAFLAAHAPNGNGG